MSLILEANYSKKIGLPGYSSHQFMVTLRTEITDINTVQAESDRLYGLLQTAVDNALQKVGYLPEAAPKNGNGNGYNGNANAPSNAPSNGNGNGHSNGNANGNGSDRWACSDKQRDLVLKITDENRLDKNLVEQLAQDRFGKNVKALNKLEASGLIDELLAQTGQRNNGRRFDVRATSGRAA